MELAKVKNAFFIGIGGIGMSALARYFVSLGIQVSGYDRYRGYVVKGLEEEGVQLCFEDKPEVVSDFIGNTTDTLVVYTPAISESSLLLNGFRTYGFQVKKRSEVLGMITRNTFCFAVAGTHGKTTTSALLTFILRYGGVDCTGFMGGIVSDFKSNLVIGKSDITVVEADEYDRSFLHLSPDMALITSMDPDHLDIYGDENQMQDSFIAFAKGMKPKGKLFAHKKLKLTLVHQSYSIEEKADFYADNITVKNGDYCFDLQLKEERIEKVKVGLPGLHNVENAVAAAGMAYDYGVSALHIAEAIAKFKGVHRRFETHYKTDRFVYIDDYAHHPEEIRMCMKSAREMYPERKLTVVFQPHLYSRTKDFSKAFAESLSMADEVYLLDIYPARELPIVGVDSQLIGSQMEFPPNYIAFDDVEMVLKGKSEGLILTLGAGSIDEWVPQLVNMLKMNQA